MSATVNIIQAEGLPPGKRIFTAIRVTAGTAEDHALLRQALQVVRPSGHSLGS